MKVNMYAISSALSLAALFACSKAQALCDIENPSHARYSIPEIIVERDVQVGEVLWTKSTPFDASVVTCQGNATEYRQNQRGAPTGASVGNSQVWTILSAGDQASGIGYVIGYDGNGAAFTGRAWPGNYPFTGTANLGGTQTSMALVVTGEVTSGTLPSGRYGIWTVGDGGPAIVVREFLFDQPVQVTKLPCAITTPSIQVPLEDVQGSELTAIGTVLKPQTFNVGLECDAGANISVEMNGIRNTDTSTEGVLQLTNAGAVGVATGVGIQILYKNAPLPFDTTLSLKQSGGGQESFPFVAQYYQTKNPVTPGEANTTMTLNMTYQ